jgi:hypothetical protein
VGGIKVTSMRTRRNLARFSLVLAAWLLAFLPGALLAQVPARIALVIGNGRYEGGTWQPLANPARDAQAVAKALKADGFRIVGCKASGFCLDATREGMESALLEFGRELRASPGAIAFVYYAGHGVQAQRTPDAPAENFLVPVHSGLEEDFQAASKAIPVQQVLDQLAAIGVQTAIVVLDACRDNGLKHPTMGPNVRGLIHSEATGFLIAYSTEPGKVALDSIPGNNVQLSPYARRLAEQLIAPGKSITDVFVDVGAQVAEDTHGQQNPEATFRLTARSSRLYLAGAQALKHETVFRDCLDGCPEMVVIPPGRFMMGSPHSEVGHFGEESPVHEVRIAYSFAVGKYPVTRGEWRQFVQVTGHPKAENCNWENPGFSQDDSHPVVCIAWGDAAAYTAWLSQKTGHHYRLLSEAEYEYVVRRESPRRHTLVT